MDDLAPEERLPRLNVYYQFWRNEHDGNRAGALHAGAHSQNPALRRNRSDLLMSLDKGIPHRDSLAKYTAAYF